MRIALLLGKLREASTQTKRFDFFESGRTKTFHAAADASGRLRRTEQKLGQWLTHDHVAFHSKNKPKLNNNKSNSQLDYATEMRDLVPAVSEKRFTAPSPRPGEAESVRPSVRPGPLLADRPAKNQTPGETHPEASEPNRSINHSQLEGCGAARGSAVDPQQLVTPSQGSRNPCGTQQGGRRAGEGQGREGGPLIYYYYRIFSDLSGRGF